MLPALPPVAPPSGLEASARFRGYGEPATWFIIRRDIAEDEGVHVVELSQ